METKMNCPACDAKIVLSAYDVPSSHYKTNLRCGECDKIIQMEVKLLAIDTAKLYRDPAWLRHEYEVKQRTQADIASQFGVTAMAINRWLKLHDIETRPRGWKMDKKD